jgi:hypothetical protein
MGRTETACACFKYGLRVVIVRNPIAPVATTQTN